MVSEFNAKYGIEGKASVGKDRSVPDDEDSTFPTRFGVVGIRGCMVIHVRDEDGNVLVGGETDIPKDGTEKSDQDRPKKRSTKLIVRVSLDAVQYARDMKTGNGRSVYQVRTFGWDILHSPECNNSSFCAF